MADDADEVVRSLIELLAIAKVAMPDYLYDIDPRVRRARRLVATRLQVSGNRPPTVLGRAQTEMVDLAPPLTLADVDSLSGAQPPWDITLGLDAFMESGLAPGTRTEAVAPILRDWLIGHGYLYLRRRRKTGTKACH